jgi:hypothetical protein
MADLAERVARVRLLLETLNDPYPTPRGALEPDSGPAPSRYVPCDACLGRGERRARGGWVLCLVCDGRGEKRRERGEPEWDAYIGLPLADAAELPRQPTPPRVVADDADESYGWERLRRAYDREGSYRALRAQLDWLSLHDPVKYRLVRTVLVEHEPRRLDAAMQTQLDLGVLAIARRMRSVKVPPWLIERTAADAQRATIEELAREGMRAGEIAKRLGITKEAVKRKLKRIGVSSAHRRNPPTGDARRDGLALATQESPS